MKLDRIDGHLILENTSSSLSPPLPSCQTTAVVNFRVPLSKELLLAGALDRSIAILAGRQKSKFKNTRPRKQYNHIVASD